MVAFDFPWPPALNHYYRSVTIKGQARVLISREGREYRHRLAMVVVLRGKAKPLAGALYLNLTLHPPDKRRRDIDGPLKALLDALTHAHVWEDDSQVRDLHIRFGNVVKGGRVVSAGEGRHDTEGEGAKKPGSDGGGLGAAEGYG